MLASNYSSEEVVFTFVYIRSEHYHLNIIIFRNGFGLKTSCTREAHASDEWPSPSSRDQPEGKVLTFLKVNKEIFLFR